MKSACSDLHIVRLQDHAALIGPEPLQSKNEALERAFRAHVGGYGVHRPIRSSRGVGKRAGPYRRGDGESRRYDPMFLMVRSRILRASNHEARVRGRPSRRGLAPAPPVMSAIALTRGRGTYPGRYAPVMGSRRSVGISFERAASASRASRASSNSRLTLRHARSAQW